jgi:hypothetical protein
VSLVRRVREFLVGVDQCVVAVRVVDVPVFLCLRSSYCHVTETGEP